MNLVLRIDNNIVAIFVSLIFIINMSLRLDKNDKKNIVFFNMFILTTIELFIETMTCIVNKQPYMWLIPITNILHLLLFILGPIVTFMCTVFVKVWVNEEYNWKSSPIMLLPLIVNILSVLSSPFLKLVFYITENNLYQRGPLFFITIITAYFYLIYCFMYIYFNKNKINRAEFLPLLLFGVFPAVGGLIQSLFYGVLLIWSSIAFALIILYIYLQQQMMHIDFLTGAWTREKLYIYLKKLVTQNKIRKFAIVFIDLDDFKEINDSFGHNEGDKVLKTIVDVIKGILGKGNYIARYGGDEFILIINAENNEEVEAVLNKMNAALENYNNLSKCPYKIKYSYGYKCYDDELKMPVGEYINYVDELMYKAKHNKKFDVNG